MKIICFVLGLLVTPTLAAAEDDAQAICDGREFHHSQSFEGRWFTKGTFDVYCSTVTSGNECQLCIGEPSLDHV